MITEFSTLKTTIHNYLRNWNSPVNQHAQVFATLKIVRLQPENQDSPLPALDQKCRKTIFEYLEILSEYDIQATELLRARFINNQSILKYSMAKNLSVDQTNKLQKRGLDALSRILWEKESDLRGKQSQHLLHQLPPRPFLSLIGHSEKLQKASELIDPNEKGCLIISGIGGIGKTAFAYAVAEQVAECLIFDDIFWLRIPPDLPGDSDLEASLISSFATILKLNGFPALAAIQKHLETLDALVIIDNLQPGSHSRQIYRFISMLSKSTSIILTTRQKPPADFNAYHFSISELETNEAKSLIKNQMLACGLEPHLNHLNENFSAIFQTVGGNPLALKLLVGLLECYDLPLILEELRECRLKDIHKMYDHIYLRAWESLSPGSQMLFIAATLSAETGASLEQLQSVSGLEYESLLTGIQTLLNKSLIELRGTVLEARYGIHNLTRTFLNSSILANYNDRIQK